jgi:hypothetical protein
MRTCAGVSMACRFTLLVDTASAPPPPLAATSPPLTPPATAAGCGEVTASRFLRPKVRELQTPGECQQSIESSSTNYTVAAVIIFKITSAILLEPPFLGRVFSLLEFHQVHKDIEKNEACKV